MLEEALASARRIIAAALKSRKKLCYAENWVYAPAVQKEAEILAKSKGQILWALGDHPIPAALPLLMGFGNSQEGVPSLGRAVTPDGDPLPEANRRSDPKRQGDSTQDRERQDS